MRKLMLLIVVLVCGLCTQAQNSPAAKERVAEIRQMYKDAWGAVAYYDTLAMDGLPSSRMVVESDYMVSGAGPRHDTVTYYLSGDFDEEKGYEYFETYFITRKYNISDLEYYEEYLFDSKRNPCFVYWRCSDGLEARFYWDEKGKLIHTITKGEEVPEAEFYLRYANKLKDAFNTLINEETEQYYKR